MENKNSALTAKIGQYIAVNGAISTAEFMAIVMSDKQHGYYSCATPFGREGDFITAPEISQLFGELIAIWIITTWIALSRPARFILCEGGPGRGTLIDDILRTLSKAAPNCCRAAEIILLETSPALREIQQQKLAKYHKSVTWIDNITELTNPADPKNKKAEATKKPLIFIANELLDVLPVHQYQKTAEGWREKLIVTNKKRENEFLFALGLPQPLPAFIEDKNFAVLCTAAPIGTIAEVSPIRTAFVKAISTKLRQAGGAALLIDYGNLQPGFGDTVQAVAKHRFVPLLENIGKSDISAHVNFAALISAAQATGCRTAGLNQGEFLLRLGLLERAGRLGAGKAANLQQQITKDVERLAAPQHMGDLFKVLCITDKIIEIPPFNQ